MKSYCFTALAAALCALLEPAHAATYTWDGSVNNWNSPHWLPGLVTWPGDGQDMVIHSGSVLLADASNYRPQTITLYGGRLRIIGAGRLFPFTDATTRVITVHTNGTLELDTWFKADSQSLGRLMPDAGRLVLNGGTLRVNGVTGYGRGATVNSGGATIETGPDADWLLNQLTDDNAWVYSGNPTLIFTGAGIGRFEKAINSGTGSVIKRGVGKWTLSRTSTYSGDTVVEQGILVLRRGSLNDTSTVSVANGAILSLRHYQGDVIGRLVLGGVTMPAGAYNRASHPQFISGSGSLIVGGTNTTGTPSLLWYYGGGGDAAIQATLSNSMNYCVDTYNSYGYLHGNIRAEYNAGVPTAQAGLGGPITFGGSRSGRTAMHEMGHVFGVGTHGNWWANLSGGIYRGPIGARLIQQIDGPGAVINSDGTHFWPYGLNYDNEGGARNEICHVRMMEAFAQDMGIFQGISTISSIGDRNIPTNSSTGLINVTIGDPGVAAGSLVLHAASSNPALVPASGIVVGGSGANRTVTITPATNMAGMAVIALTVSGGRDAAIETFALTVGGFDWEGDFVPLVAADAVWKFHAAGANLGTAWRELAYNDSTWSSGPSMLGFGDANGLLPATLVASNGQWTTYFRRAFQVPVPSQIHTLAGRILRDDAAVVYLNGVEVWRDSNLPRTGAIGYTTPALAGLGGADESAWISFPLDSAALLTGTNVLAIEVHQSAVNSSDLAMNFELAATLSLPSDVQISITGNTLTWPAEAGWFSLHSTTNLAPPVTWTPVTNATVLTSNQWRVTLPAATNGQRFFRLQTP